MLKHYETVIIFSPILGEEDVKKSVNRYVKVLTDQGASITEERNWGLKQLAYPIKGKSNGIYYIVEYAAPTVSVLKLETEFRRDENVIRFLTTSLDKFAIEYNDRRRAGLVGTGKKNRKEPKPAVITEKNEA
jgi:small subunit ribosomal protein S6